MAMGESVDVKEFNKEAVGCMNKGVISERMGEMLMILVDNAIHSKSFGSHFPRSIIEEARGFAIEHLVNAFVSGKSPDNKEKFLSYYYTIASNFLRDFRSKRTGNGATKDIYGHNITVITRPSGALFGTKKIEFITIDDYLYENN